MQYAVKLFAASGSVFVRVQPIMRDILVNFLVEMSGQCRF